MECNNGETFFKKDEPQSVTIQCNNEFKIVGGVLLKYLGNQSEVSIPEGIIAIGKEAFKNNLSVRKVIFSKTVRQIDSNAFEGCANLIEIENYSNISKYDDECFKYAGLRRVTIGHDVECLGKACFSHMPNLETILYCPGKTLKLKNTFAYCSRLTDLEEDGRNFFPSCRKFIDVRNNPDNKRPTWGDAFVGTPYIGIIQNKYLSLYQKGICPECGGKINKHFFHAKCNKCGIDYIN